MADYIPVEKPEVDDYSGYGRGDIDPDAIEVPDPYTTDEWGNTEGARVQADLDRKARREGTIADQPIGPGEYDGPDQSDTGW